MKSCHSLNGEHTMPKRKLAQILGRTVQENSMYIMHNILGLSEQPHNHHSGYKSALGEIILVNHHCRACFKLWY
jgi:hypothetical protein